MLGFIRRSDHAFFVECIILVFGLFIGTVMTLYPDALNLKLMTVCEKNVTRVRLTLSSVRFQMDNPYTCNIMLKEEAQSRDRAVMKQMLSSSKAFIEKLLKTDTDYIVRVKCGTFLSTPTLKFNTGKLACKPGILETSVDSTSSDTTSTSSDITDIEPVYKEEHVFSVTTTDIVLGVFFGLFTFGIIVVTSYYMYGRYKRRRRLQQFLRTPHTDPFESLQSYMEVESS